MFIGHFALALGAKKTTPSVSLGTTFLACQFADLLWPTLVVLSHYLLDVITHRPDLPITIHGARRLGLGLWNYPGTALAIELSMFFIGGALYTSVTVARDAIGRIGFWALYVFLVAIYFAALYGPPPPSSASVAIAGHLSWLFVVWAYWVDHHRRAR